MVNSNWRRIGDRLVRHLLSVIGAILTIVGFVSLLTSKSVRVWVENHSYEIFIALIMSFTIGFIIVDYVIHRKNNEATDHDRKVFAGFLNDMPASAFATMWLKTGTIYNTIPMKVLDALNDVLVHMGHNVVGFDDRETGADYDQLKIAMEKFRSLVALNMFMNRDGDYMSLSERWSSKQRDEAADKIENAQAALVAAYDRFLITAP